MLSTAFLTHSEVYEQVDLQGCVRVDSGTGVTQNPSTDFIRVVRQTSRNQFGSNPTWVRIPPAAPRRSKLCIACSDFFKSQSALTPLLLLSKSQPLTLGCDLGPPLCGGFVPLRGNIDFNRPFHVGAKSALLLLSNCDPLRWARSWCAALRATSQYQRLLTNPPAVQEEKFTIFAEGAPLYPGQFDYLTGGFSL